MSDHPPLDYERRKRRGSLSDRARRIALDVLAILPAVAVPVWAFFVTRRVSDSAARYASLPAVDVWLIVLTFAIPIGFALLACGPMARDDARRR